MNALDAIPLPADARWTDRNEPWPRVAQSVDYTVDGTLVIEEWVPQAGRPVTLDLGWIDGALLVDLMGKLAQRDNMALAFQDNAYTVRWRHADGAIDANPVLDYADPAPEDQYEVVLRLIEV